MAVLILRPDCSAGEGATCQNVEQLFVVLERLLEGDIEVRRGGRWSRGGNNGRMRFARFLDQRPSVIVQPFGVCKPAGVRQIELGA